MVLKKAKITIFFVFITELTWIYLQMLCTASLFLVLKQGRKHIRISYIEIQKYEMTKC